MCVVVQSRPTTSKAPMSKVSQVIGYGVVSMTPCHCAAPSFGSCLGAERKWRPLIRQPAVARGDRR